MKVQATLLVVSFFCIALSAGQFNPPQFPIFQCPSLPTPPPANDINKLRPGNIKAIMAVGDSISAGFAMSAGEFWDVLDLVEYRGDVFSVGGNPGANTVANFLKRYNKDIVGASIGDSPPLDAIKWQGGLIQPWDAKITHLNGAQSMAKIEAVPSQIDYITGQLNTTYKNSVDINKDWKLMTMLIGANDACVSCYHFGGNVTAGGDHYEQVLRTSLDKIYKQIPRTFVNILPMFNITQVVKFATTDYCDFMWYTVSREECPCMTDKENMSTPKDLLTMDLAITEYNKRIYKVVNEWKAKNLTDFKVVIQPFLTNLVIPPEYGLKLVSNLDCFHPNQVSDAGWALGLWNSMFTPESEKPSNIPFEKPIVIKCPNENSYLQ